MTSSIATVPGSSGGGVAAASKPIPIPIGSPPVSNLIGRPVSISFSQSGASLPSLQYPHDPPRQASYPQTPGREHTLYVNPNGSSAPRPRIDGKGNPMDMVVASDGSYGSYPQHSYSYPPAVPTIAASPPWNMEGNPVMMSQMASLVAEMLQRNQGKGGADDDGSGQSIRTISPAELAKTESSTYRFIRVLRERTRDEMEHTIMKMALRMEGTPGLVLFSLICMGAAFSMIFVVSFLGTENHPIKVNSWAIGVLVICLCAFPVVLTESIAKLQFSRNIKRLDVFAILQYYYMTQHSNNNNQQHHHHGHKNSANKNSHQYHGGGSGTSGAPDSSASIVTVHDDSRDGAVRKHHHHQHPQHKAREQAAATSSEMKTVGGTDPNGASPEGKNGIKAGGANDGNSSGGSSGMNAAGHDMDDCNDGSDKTSPASDIVSVGGGLHVVSPSSALNYHNATMANYAASAQSCPWYSSAILVCLFVAAILWTAVVIDIAALMPWLIVYVLSVLVIGDRQHSKQVLDSLRIPAQSLHGITCCDRCKTNSKCCVHGPTFCRWWI